MVLSFSTQIDGKETYFIEKIWKGLLNKNFNLMCYNNSFRSSNEAIEKNIELVELVDKIPKIHTIREDKNNRWKAGVTIDFFINTRQKNMFRFAPKIPVVSTQDVLMTYYHSDVIQISIDDRELFSYTERLEFAINDGFDCWEDFFQYFYPKITASNQKNYKAKIIHWTHFKY